VRRRLGGLRLRRSPLDLVPEGAPAVTRPALDDAVMWASIWSLALVLFIVLVCSCVTRTTVCVETSHGVGPADASAMRRDSVGASVCAEVERR